MLLLCNSLSKLKLTQHVGAMLPLSCVDGCIEWKNSEPSADQEFLFAFQGRVTNVKFSTKNNFKAIEAVRETSVFHSLTMNSIAICCKMRLHDHNFLQ